jgi:hypothetical protein
LEVGSHELLPGLASNLGPVDLHLPSSVSHQHLVVFVFLFCLFVCLFLWH